MNEKMTNQSLRERFQFPEKKSESVSRPIRDALEAEKIKVRYRGYVPFWAKSTAAPPALPQDHHARPEPPPPEKPTIEPAPSPPQPEETDSPPLH